MLYKRYIPLICLILAALPTMLPAQAQPLRILIEQVAHLPVPNGQLYLASDLNGWSPGDPNFAFRKDSLGRYYLDIANPRNRFEYKITQGNWTLAEGDSMGTAIPNRLFDRREAPDPNLVRIRIEGWERKVVYTFIVRKLPENTPKDATLYITGNFNNWEPADPLYKLHESIDGSWRATIYSDLDPIEFKFTRGDWNSVEGRRSGKAMPNRTVSRHSNINHTAIDIEIDGWEDLSAVFNLFSLYDLLLLFSVFQGVLLLIAIPTIQDYNRSANKWVAITIAVASFFILIRTVGSYRPVAEAFTKVLLLPDFVIFLYAPLFYVYLQKLLFNRSITLSNRRFNAFIPAIVQLIAYLPFFLMSNRTLQLSFLNQDRYMKLVFMITAAAGLIWNTWYWFLFRKMLRYYRQQYQSHFSYEQNLNYLNTVLIIQGICLALWYALFLFGTIGNLTGINIPVVFEGVADVIWLAFSTITYFVGYYAIHQPEIFKITPENFSVYTSEPATGGSKINRAAEAIPEKPESEDENITHLKEKVAQYIESSKAYTNPRLTLNELAGKLKMPPHLLSRVINEGFERNFFDFINTYRIEDFKRRVEDPKNRHYTLLGLAYDVGFNSKTAFNRSFKKITGQTPSEYYNESKIVDGI